MFKKQDSRLRYFRLNNGRYQEQVVAATNPRLWIPELEVGLAVWQGTFEGLPQAWLRWCDTHGILLPTDTEAALQRESEAQRQRDQAELQVRQTVLNLIAFGMAIAQVAQMTGLSVQEVEAIASRYPQGDCS